MQKSVGAASLRAMERHVERGNAARIVACVNGCAGIANPAAIPKMFEALSRIARAKPDRLDHTIDVGTIERAARVAHAALARLRGE